MENEFLLVFIKELVIQNFFSDTGIKNRSAGRINFFLSMDKMI